MEKEDLENEIWIICLEAMDDYDDSKGPLENFLRISVRNGLVNKYKTISKIVSIPCFSCKFHKENNKENDCGLYENAGTVLLPENGRFDCDKWIRYKASMNSRNALNAIVPNEKESVNNLTPDEILSIQETKDIVIERMPKEFHDDLLEIMDGGKVSLSRERQIKKQIDIIIDRCNR